MEQIDYVLITKKATKKPEWKNVLKSHIPNLDDHIFEMIELNNHKGTNFLGTVLVRKNEDGACVWHQNPYIQSTPDEFFKEHPLNSLIWGVTEEDTNF
jgi:hypothetical protein